MKHPKRIQEIIDNQGKTEAKIIKLFEDYCKDVNKSFDKIGDAIRSMRT